MAKAWDEEHKDVPEDKYWQNDKGGEMDLVKFNAFKVWRIENGPLLGMDDLWDVMELPWEPVVDPKRSRGC